MTSKVVSVYLQQEKCLAHAASCDMCSLHAAALSFW